MICSQRVKTFPPLAKTVLPTNPDTLASQNEQQNTVDRDWKHPHAPNNDKWGGSARPKYDAPDPFYKYGEEHDLNIYLEFMNDQISELLEMFPNIGAIWLDGFATPRSGDWSVFKCQELYDMIHAAHPHMLVSYKQGLIGTEDFMAPERHFKKEDTLCWK